MPITVGRVPYLHTEPFYFDMPRRGIELRDFMPSKMAAAAESGEIDAGLVPVVDAFRLEDRFNPIVGFCIACNDSSGSVFLYSTKPIEELSGARIGVTDEAATAPKLLEVLLKLKYGISPGEYVPLQPQEYDAFLIIGNRALRQRRGARGFPHRYDLGQEWNSWTGLPFVFARWIARKDMDSKELALLEDTLYVGLEDGVDALYHLNEPKDELLMLPRDVVNHLQGVRYFMGLSEQKGLNTFREYLNQLDS
ncbi:MAG: menaquinone biosynthesis protein [Chloroflexi bacterium]|nr:menaquinone biosynthesis protein [Chloroflexota bacterium]MDA1218151.1 menaquinone biosynthesis protein [Chloroflexota bacterium]PKB57375.1 MAG: hypothetical protein BZY73_03530 [SAR202 cluster bacterium Casp-Chloro-G3]